MDWSETEAADALVVRPVGKIDESNWQEFSEKLTDSLARTTGKRLIIDFSGVDYMSSRGLRALTLAKKAAGGTEIALAAPDPRMREIFAISRYDKIFPVLDALP